MTEVKDPRKELMDEIRSKKMGDKKYHSESSLQHFGEDEEASASDSNKDPGVLNESMQDVRTDEHLDRRRAMSQPGPASGSLSTATAARAARRRPPRNVMYAANLERNDSADRLPKLAIINRDEDLTPPSVFGSPSPLYFNGNPRNGDFKSPSTPGALFYNGNLRNGDIKSPNSPGPLYYNGNPRNGDNKLPNKYASFSDLRSGTPRKRSEATVDAQSFRSFRSTETHAPPPTSAEDNNRITWQHLTIILSIMYAVLLVTIGFIFYLADSLVEPAIAPIYNIALTVIGMVYQLFLIIDLTRYKSIVLKNQRLKGMHDENIAEYFSKQEEEMSANISGERTPDVYKPPVPPALLTPLTHDYCFSHGRHSGSFYLKLGAAGFALGHLIHSVLMITVQISYYLDENIENDECIVVPQVVYDVLNPIYCFIQLYFIFKYSNVIVLRAQRLAHFGFMHMIGSSLCFWVSTIVRETILALTIYANSIYGSNKTDINIVNGINNYSTGMYSPEFEDIELKNERFFDVENLFNKNCQASVTINSILENFSPYLYPFSVEFNILIVAFYYIIWSHIGRCENEDNTNTDESSSLADNTTVCKIPTADEDNDYTSNLVIYADCHASNKGLFLGLVLVVVVAGQLIIGFVFSSVGEYFMLKLGTLLNDCTSLVMHVLMLFAAILAYKQIIKLDVNEHPMSLLDDVLLFICKPAFFMETVFSLVATINIINVVKSVDIIIMVVQVIIQSTLLIMGLRRCSNTRKHRRQKPGREVLMFLLIANVGMWLFYTFSFKTPDSLDERYEFYGKVVWSILGHISLPLMMFYRFHSSVCFADIWDYAYKPGSDH